MTLHFSAAAEDDLVAIYLESINRFGVAQAERYRAQLDRAFALIDTNPQLAQLRRELHPPLRIHPAGSHMIVYRTQDDGDAIS